MFSRRLFGLLAGLAALAGCSAPEAVKPALWQVDGPDGQRAWLFGTIHALPEPVDWRSPAITQALSASDRLLVEVAAIDDPAAIAATFSRLGTANGLAPVAMRLGPEDRGELNRDLAEAGLPAAALDRFETWAAALALQQALSAKSGSDSANGIDRDLVRSYRGRIEEFEGAAAQLAIFDGLADADQRELLLGVIHADDPQLEADRLARAWKRGDIELIAREVDGEFLSDPELREALLVRRNQAWIGRLTEELGRGARPFVAVGTAHLAGPEGLPALLAARGYRVTRLQ